MGRPNPINVAELGPGRGGMMVDFLRVRIIFPQCSKVLDCKEVSRVLESSPISLC